LKQTLSREQKESTDSGGDWSFAETLDSLMSSCRGYACKLSDNSNIVNVQAILKNGSKVKPRSIIYMYILLCILSYDSNCNQNMLM